MMMYQKPWMLIKKMKIFNWFKNENNWKTLNKKLPTILIFYPVLISVIYLTVISKDRYISTAQVTVKKPADATNGALNIGLLMGSSTPSSTEDVLYLKNYIFSAGMLNAIDKELDLKNEFSNSGLDILNGLPSHITKEAYLRFFQNHVKASIDDKTGLLNIETDAFTPEFALKFNKAILKESERFINELSHKIVQEQLSFAEQQVQEAFIKLNHSKQAVLDYQNKYGLLDPLSQAEAASKMITEMEGQKVQLETQLRNELTFLKENTPQVTSTKNALNSLNQQIEQERGKVAAPKGPNNIQLNELAAQYQLIKGQLDFDASVYKTALSAAEKTRIETAHKLKILSVVIAPQQAEEAEYPHRIYILFSLLLSCLLLFGTIKLILAVIEDHRD